MTILDPARLQKLTERHQLTYRELGDLLDLDPQDLRLGLPAKRLPVAALNRLAELLGETPLTTGPPADSDLDRARLGAHLATTVNGATRDDMAYALGWPLDRLERALASLDAALGDNGLRVIAFKGRLRIAGRLEHTTAQSRQRASQSTITSVDNDLARALYGAIGERALPARTDSSNIDQARRLGLVEPAGGRGAVRLAESVRFSLCLDASGTRSSPVGRPHPLAHPATLAGDRATFTSAPCCPSVLVGRRRWAWHEHVSYWITRPDSPQTRDRSTAKPFGETSGATTSASQRDPA